MMRRKKVPEMKIEASVFKIRLRIGHSKSDDLHFDTAFYIDHLPAILSLEVCM